MRSVRGAEAARGLVLTEGGTVGLYAASLLSRPRSNVTVRATVAEGRGELAAGPSKALLSRPILPSFPVLEYLLELASGAWVLECGVLPPREA